MFSQLRDVGYGRLTMGTVATAAGTGKAALYRRWCTKEELVADALRHGLPSPHDVPAHGTVRADLVEQLRGLRDALARTRGAALKAGAEDGMVRAAFTDRVLAPCERQILEALQRGAQRGEVRPEAVRERIAAVGPAMLIHQMLTVNSKVVSDADVDALVDEVVLPML